MIRLVWVLLAALIAIFGTLFGLKRCDDSAAQHARRMGAETVAVAETRD